MWVYDSISHWGISKVNFPYSPLDEGLSQCRGYPVHWQADKGAAASGHYGNPVPGAQGCHGEPWTQCQCHLHIVGAK